MTTGKLGVWGSASAPALAGFDVADLFIGPASPRRRKGASGGIVPDNLKELSRTTEYPANGSFDRRTHMQSMRACQRKIWSSLTAD